MDVTDMEGINGFLPLLFTLALPWRLGLLAFNPVFPACGIPLV
jgi:hypothetical protein